MSSIWISEAALNDLTEEADRTYPLETGGVLAGYFAENGEPVVLAAIGPGPMANHRRYRFTPDHAWQCRQLDLLFEQSSGTYVYLGDWHTHPDGSPQMSWLDRRTLRAIARHPHARTPHPLMLIGGRSTNCWDWTCHQYRGERLLGFITDRAERHIRTFQEQTMTAKSALTQYADRK